MATPILTPDSRVEPALSAEERRWLHDKYERLAADEAELADSRTSYFATLAAGLTAGFVLLVINVLGQRLLFTSLASGLAIVGILISVVWAVVLHRTTAALELWRAAALELESSAPPILAPAPWVYVTRRGRRVHIDLTLPYQSHFARFSADAGAPWIDRVRPSDLASVVPMILLVFWSTVLLVVWLRFWSLPH